MGRRVMNPVRNSKSNKFWSKISNGMNKRAHTLTELLIAGSIAILLVASVLGAFMLIKSIYTHGMANYFLQRDVDTLMAKIVRGSKESTGTYGLRSAVSFTIPSATPAGSRIDFVGTDADTRTYFLNNNTIIYNSPTQAPNQQVIYTPPSNSTVTLLFWEPGGYIDHELVGIYLAVSQQVGGRNASGSITTYVNLRNVPK
jgi:hypothetical protein